MLTTVLEWLGVGTAALAPVLGYVATRTRSHRADLAELTDRLDQRDATIAALWDYVLDLRYWMVKGSAGEPPTMPTGLTVAAVRARLAA